MKLTEIQGKSSSREESYLSVLKKKIDAAFKDHALIIVSKIQEINGFLRQMLDLEDDVRLMLKVNIPADQGTKAFDDAYWKVVEVVSETFPPDNMLGIKPQLVEGQNAGFVILKRVSLDER